MKNSIERYRDLKFAATCEGKTHGLSLSLKAPSNSELKRRRN
jgi:hypothetical protein